jgi:hypothetical protein
MSDDLRLVALEPRMHLARHVRTDADTGQQYSSWLLDCVCGFRTQAVAADVLFILELHADEHARTRQLLHA